MSQPFTSYAQNFEDLMLFRALGHIRNGFYIDVGAQDPVIDSVSKVFYDAGWRGINVEPVPEYANALMEHRPRDKTIAAAVSSKEGVLTLHRVQNTGLSTVVDGVAAQYGANSDTGHAVDTVEIAATTLGVIARDLGDTEVHWLKIDVEGHEEAALKGWDTTLLRPWVIVVEATLPNSQEPSYHAWEPLVTGADYRFVYADGLNRFYLRNDKHELRAAFAYPPNVFDNLRLPHHSALCHDMVVQFSQQITERDVTIATLNGTILGLSADLRAARYGAGQASERVRELEDNVLQLRDTLAEKIAHIEALLSSVEQLETANRSLAAEKQALQTSFFWRLTGPLRGLVSLCRQLIKSKDASASDIATAPKGTTQPTNASGSAVSLADSAVKPDGPATDPDSVDALPRDDVSPDTQQWLTRLDKAQAERSDQ